MSLGIELGFLLFHVRCVLLFGECNDRLCGIVVLELQRPLDLLKARLVFSLFGFVVCFCSGI